MRRGAVVNVVTKVRNQPVPRRCFSNSFATAPSTRATLFPPQPRTTLKRNQYGDTIGGPVQKDKMFFFFQVTRGRAFAPRGNANNTILPTAANLNGDCSNYLTANSAVNPQGKVIQINDPTTGNPFPNNQIPVSPVAVSLSKLLPVSQAAANGRITYGDAHRAEFQWSM